MEEGRSEKSGKRSTLNSQGGVGLWLKVVELRSAGIEPITDGGAFGRSWERSNLTILLP